MIDSALACLAQQLDTHLQARAGTGPGQVALARFVDDNGRWAVADDSVGLMLINVQMDRAQKAPPASDPLAADPAKAEPPLSLNLSVLVAAQSRNYSAALAHLSHVLAFFHAHPVFTRAQYPALGPSVEMVDVTLEAVDYEQLDHIWTFVGGRQVPSVVYRVRLAGG
jgi:hypothetical protein